MGLRIVNPQQTAILGGRQTSPFGLTSSALARPAAPAAVTASDPVAGYNANAGLSTDKNGPGDTPGMDGPTGVMSGADLASLGKAAGFSGLMGLGTGLLAGLGPTGLALGLGVGLTRGAIGWGARRAVKGVVDFFGGDKADAGRSYGPNMGGYGGLGIGNPGSYGGNNNPAVGRFGPPAIGEDDGSDLGGGGWGGDIGNAGIGPDGQSTGMSGNAGGETGGESTGGSMGVGAADGYGGGDIY